jgi:hypothetical protein
MRRWIALGVGAVGMAWGPYLYAELQRAPSAARPHEDRPALLLASQPSAADTRATEQQLSAATAISPEPARAKPPRPRELPLAAPAPEAANDPASDTEHSEPAVEGLPSELAPAFRRTFDSEPRDAFWAVDEEPRLAGLLHGAGVPDGDVAEVACRKTVCRVAFSSLELEADVASKFYARMHQEFDRALALDTPDATQQPEQQAALYILRPGYKLEH